MLMDNKQIKQITKNSKDKLPIKKRYIPGTNSMI
jgi:hypothetical protein